MNPSYNIVQINNNMYTVFFVEANSPALKSGELLGSCYTTTKQIYVSKEIPNKRDILRHEITHAVIYEFIAVDITWNEEKVCEFVQRYHSIIENYVNGIYIEGESNDNPGA